MSTLPNASNDVTTRRDDSSSPGPLAACLLGEHRQLDALLAQAIGDGGALDAEAFASFRAKLLRHIGVEEKILLPALRERLQVLPGWAFRIRLDHAAIAALLVPTPDVALAREIQGLMAGHEAIEEGPQGLFATCEVVAADALDELVARIERAPEVPCARHFDGHGTVRTAEAALELARRTKRGLAV